MAKLQLNRIVLTHWNAGVFRAASLPYILQELAIYTLLYDEVLIRDEDLITNRRLTRLLSETSNFAIFSELLTSGLVKLLRLPLDAYPSNRRFDPVYLPISARAEEHQIRRSYKGNPWKATSWEWQFFRRLDDIVARVPSASRFHEPFGAGNSFAAQLADILENRQSYRLSSHPVFRHLDERTAEQFAAFCRDPDEWRRFLRNRGLTNPIVGPEAGFFRSAAYQCSRFLPTSRAIRRLVESVYAATYCGRETADGRYGGSELVELPYRYESENERAAAGEEAVRIEVTPTAAVLTMRLDSGLAAILQNTRSSAEFVSVQRAMSDLGKDFESPLLVEAKFKETWRSLCAVYAEHSATARAKSTRADHKIVNWAVFAYVLSRVLGILILPALRADLEIAVAEDAIAIAAMEKLGPKMLKGFRALVDIPALRTQAEESVSVRCSTVPLSVSEESGEQPASRST